MKPTPIIAHVTSMDNPLVIRERTSRGKGRSFEDLPAQKAQKRRSASGKQARGRKKDIVSKNILRPDTLLALLPLGHWAFPVSMVSNMMWGFR